MLNTYDIGDAVEVFAAFTKRSLLPDELRTFRETRELPGEVGVVPASITCTVLSPDGVTGEVEVNEPEEGSGVQVAVIEPDRHGVWYAAFDGEGGYKASGEHSFLVRERRVPR